MSFAQKLSSGVQKHMAHLKAMYANRVAAAEARAQQRLANARTKTEKELVKLQLVRDKMSAKKELYEAQVATRRAREALEKARKEAGDLTLGERLGVMGKDLQRRLWQPQKPTRRQAVRKRASTPRTVASTTTAKTTKTTRSGPKTATKTRRN